MTDIHLHDPVNEELVVPKWYETEVISAIQNEEQKKPHNCENLKHDNYYQTC